MNDKYPRWGMRWICTVLVLMAAVGLAISVEYCTPSTCPPGPVKLTFQYSNCSGDIRYEAMLDDWNVCKNTTSDRGLTSRRHSYNIVWIEKADYVDTDNCGGGHPGTTRTGIRFYTGSCQPGGSSSIMYLSNVNQSYIAPQIPEINPRTDVPEYDPQEEPCNDPVSCSALGDIYSVKFANNTCPSSGITYEVDANTVIGQCYWRLAPTEVYTSPRCIGPHTVEIVDYLNSDCTRPISSIIEGQECGTGFRRTKFCIAPPAPTGHSERLSFSILVLTLFIVTIINI